MTAHHAHFVLSPSLLAATLALSMNACVIDVVCPGSSDTGGDDGDDENDGDDESDTEDSGEPSYRSLRLIVKSSSPQFAIGDFELIGTPEGSSWSLVGPGVAQIEGLVGGGFASYIAEEKHVEGFACVDTSGAEESQYTVVLTPLAPAQIIEDASVDAFIQYGGVSVFVPGGTLVDPDDPLTPVTGEVEFFATPIPHSQLPEAVNCPEGIVREDGEDLNAKVGFMALADLTPRKDGKKLQIIDGGWVAARLPVPPLLAQEYLAAPNPPPLHFYYLNSDGYWEQTADTELVFDGDKPFVDAFLTHFTPFAGGFGVSTEVEDITAHAIQPLSHEGREILYTTFHSGAISIGRKWVPPGPAFEPQTPGCIEVLDLANGEEIDIRYLSGPGLNYTVEGNGVAGACEEGDALVHLEPLVNPDGASSGAPCLMGDQCNSGVCGIGYNAEGQLSGMCGECISNIQCVGGGTCMPGTPLFPGGPRCTYGDIGDLCQSDAGCQVDGSVCSGLVSIEGEVLKTCSYCSTDGQCGPGTSCHPIVYPDLAPLPLPAWNACVPDGTLPQNHICELAGSGDDACEGFCTEQLILGEMLYGIGACGECDNDMDCGMGEVCMPPPDLSGLLELFFDGLQGSTCVPG